MVVRKRGLKPSNLSPAYLIQAAGGDPLWPGGATRLDCPECVHCDVETADEVDGVWVSCRHCGWHDDLFGWACRKAGNWDAQVVVNMLREAGCPRADRLTPQDVRAYAADREFRQLCRELGEAADRRGSDRTWAAVRHWGLDHKPVNPPHWGLVSAAEAAGSWEASAPRRTYTGLVRAVLHNSDNPAHEVLLTLPEEDRPGRRVGFWFYGTSHTPVHCVRDNCGSGYGFFRCRTDQSKAWGETAVITTSPNTALLVQGGQSKFTPGRTLPLLLAQIGEAGPPSTQWLPRRPYLFHAPEACSGYLYRAAARLSADVATGSMCFMHDVPPEVQFWEVFGARRVPWWEDMGARLHALTDAGVSVAVAQFGTDPEGMKLLKDRLRPELYNRISALTRRAPNRRVHVAARLTAEDDGENWFWVERGTVLLNAVPRVVRVYRAKGRVRYAGVVRYRGADYPFDSALFRRDPAGTVERALLHGGAGGSPVVHPALVGRLADIALYFHPPLQSE